MCRPGRRTDRSLTPRRNAASVRCDHSFPFHLDFGYDSARTTSYFYKLESCQTTNQFLLEFRHSWQRIGARLRCPSTEFESTPLPGEPDAIQTWQSWSEQLSGGGRGGGRQRSPHAHSLTVLSTPHEISQGWLGCVRAQTTRSVCPVSTAATLPSVTSTHATVPAVSAPVHVSVAASDGAERCPSPNSRWRTQCGEMQQRQRKCWRRGLDRRRRP